MDEENKLDASLEQSTDNATTETPVYEQPTYQEQSTYQEQTTYQQPRPSYSYEQPVKEPAEKPSGAGFGIASLVLGILALVTFCMCINVLFAVLAIIFGIIQLVRSSSSGGKGMAIGGLITSGLSIVAMLIFWGIVGASAVNFSDPDSIMQFYEEEYPEVFDESGDYDYDYDYDYDDDLHDSHHDDTL